MNNETLKRDLCARLPYGVKGELIHDLREDFVCEDFVEDIEIFDKGSVWTYEGYSSVCIPLGEGDFEGFLIQHKSGAYTSVGKSIKPYLFPTSALTKPIQLANYNNGEPFVPIIEMAKYQYKDVYFEIIDNRCIGRLNVGVVLEFVIEDEIPFYKEFHNNMFGQSVSDSYDDMFRANINPSEITKLFHQWHINIELSPDQFIEVTEENNPYK